jgi:hypothetical protein
MFRKHILNKGPLIHPKTGARIDIDDEFVRALKTNFENQVCDIVQVPKAGPNNEHTEDPDRNIGEVIGIEERAGKVYALIDARSDSDADKLGKTLLGASAQMHLNYTDTRTGKRVGPTLLHVAVTNRPYVLGLEDYEELVAASAEGSDEVVVLTEASAEQEEEIHPMTLDELKALLKAEHQIDLDALQAQSAEVAKLTSSLAEAGVLKLSNGEVLNPDDVVGAFQELANDNVSLSSRVEKLEAEGHVAAVKALVAEGRILPAQESAMVELRKANLDLFAKLVPEKPLVPLSNELGTEGLEKPGESQELDIDAEIARLTATGGPASNYIR